MQLPIVSSSLSILQKEQNVSTQINNKVINLRFGQANAESVTDIFSRLGSSFQPEAAALSSLETLFPPHKNFAFAGDNFGPVDPKFVGIMGASLTLPHMTYQKGGKLLDHAQQVFQKEFSNSPNEPVVTFFCPTGTAAGRLVMIPVMRSVDGIVAADNAHLFNRECGSHHRLNSSSVYTLPTQQGKLSVESFQKFLDTYNQRGHWTYPNNAKPKVLSLSQPTEYGRAYSDEEVRAFAEIAHKHDMLLHMDGSRLFYLAGQSGKSLKQLTTDLGVDMLFIGGSKNKMIMSEAAVFTPNFFKNARGYSRNDTPESLMLDLKSYAKQYGMNVGQAVASAAQFTYALESGYATKLTKKAFQQAKNLESLLKNYTGVHLSAPTETNVVLVSMDPNLLTPLRKKYELMVFPDSDPVTNHPVVRFMTSGSTHDKDLLELKTTLDKIMNEQVKTS